MLGTALRVWKRGCGVGYDKTLDEACNQAWLENFVTGWVTFHEYLK